MADNAALYDEPTEPFGKFADVIFKGGSEGSGELLTPPPQAAKRQTITSVADAAILVRLENCVGGLFLIVNHRLDRQRGASVPSYDLRVSAKRKEAVKRALSEAIGSLSQ